MKNINSKVLKHKGLFFVFLVIAANAYSQEVDCSQYKPFYLFSGKENKVYYIDSVVVNGETVYTDSITVNVSLAYTDSILVDGLVIYTDSIVIGYGIGNYPIVLKNNPPFQYAIFRDDCCEFYRRMTFISMGLIAQYMGPNKLQKKEKGKVYYILYMDDRFVNYAYISKKNADYYDKYYPMQADISFSRKQYYKKMLDWILQEMNKGLIVSIGRKDSKTYILKSFEPVSNQ